MFQRYLVLPVLLIASALAFAACGSSNSDASQVSDVVQSAATSTDPADCTNLMTLSFVEQNEQAHGQTAVKQCEQQAGDPGGHADSATVSNVQVNGSNATAGVAVVGGAFDGQTLSVALVKDGDQWKLDRFTGFAKFDKEKLLNAFHDQLTAPSAGLSEAQATCIVSNLGRAPNAQVEQLVISGNPAPFVALAKLCT